MAPPKYTIYIWVRLKDGSRRYCRAARYANQTIKPDVVTEAKTRNTPRATTISPAPGNGFPQVRRFEGTAVLILWACLLTLVNGRSALVAPITPTDTLSAPG